MLQLQKAFNELDGEATTIRDRCVKSASVEITDLKYYAKADDFPKLVLIINKVIA
jgi:vacuolar-type H+-ATPase subunit H